ncbi:MAG TPA: condensation domain-containing protein [Streptosporangiaceae bacterium]|nr:condensation domain-containing protein [Streptosporangiaceae bacterium]
MDFEELIVSTAKEILGREVRLADNFFGLGGDSLMALRFEASIEEKTGLEKVLQDIFMAPTFETLAEQIGSRIRDHALSSSSAAGANAQCDQSVPAASTGDGLTYRQRRLLSRHFQTRPDLTASSAGNVWAVFRVTGLLDFARLDAALAGLTQRHDALRMCFAQVDGRPLRVAGSGSYPFLEQLNGDRHLPDSEALRSVVTRMMAPFALRAEPKIRACVANISARSAYLGFAADHLVCDGGSMRLLLRDLGLAYREATDGEARFGESQAQSFVDWTEREQFTYSTEELQRRLDYWRRVLDPLEPYPELRLPGMKERAPGTRPAMAAIDRRLGHEFATSFKACAASSGVTIYAACCAVLMLAVHAETRRSAIGFHSPVSVRQSGWENSVGFFSNVLPIRVRVDPSRTPAEISKSVMTRVAEAARYAIPTPVLFENLQPEQYTSFNWRPRVYFDGGAEAEDAVLELENLKVRYVPTLSVADQELPPRDGIMVNVYMERSGMRFTMVYESDLWPSRRAARFLGNYVKAVERSVPCWHSPSQHLLSEVFD